MADKDDKHPLNSNGKYYCDISCIDCGACLEIAPNHFTRDNDEGLAYLYRQPTTPNDLEIVIEAMENCPVEAIGDDGDELTNLHSAIQNQQ